MPPNEYVLGLDIGGANVKAAKLPFSRRHSAAVLENGPPQAESLAFPMWQKPERLSDALAQVALQLDASEQPAGIGVTMTGELADCFATRREGVSEILTAVEHAFPGLEAKVYSVTGEWLDIGQARLAAWDVAASNWHATASWLGRIYEGKSHFLMVDIGSTTCDIIPVLDGVVATTAKTDRDRLMRQQLVYSGYERTPVAAVVQKVTLPEGECPVMAERFADTLDAYLVLGEEVEDPTNCDTADGRPRTKFNAESRLARMIGEDAETMSADQLQSISAEIVRSQAATITRALVGNAAEPPEDRSVIFVGHGHGLQAAVQAELAANHGGWSFDYLDQLLSHTWGLAGNTARKLSRCAPAVAVAELLVRHMDKTLSQ